MTKINLFSLTKFLF